MRIAGSIALVLLALTWALPANAEIAISRRDCERLVRHEPAADVTYQPGVDVHGQPVMPADLGGGAQIELPDVIYIPIEVLIQDKFAIPANSVLYDATALVGVVSVRGNQVYFQDQVLADPEIAALEEACRERGEPD
ncbi:hypothetical protein [Dongia deserti]|uniref:hypothetical protein n=1 Tax=Dongia deserti TaxID=2268030 RepID=UPI000E6537C6|nr:hypothetical protein [Dongia deserti]